MWGMLIVFYRLIHIDFWHYIEYKCIGLANQEHSSGYYTLAKHNFPPANWKLASGFVEG